jgi:hypothetical protein
VHLIRSDDGLATRFIAHFQHFEARAMVVDQTQQPVVTVVPDLALRIPFRHELAAVFLTESLCLVLADV